MTIENEIENSRGSFTEKKNTAEAVKRRKEMERSVHEILTSSRAQNSRLENIIIIIIIAQERLIHPIISSL